MEQFDKKSILEMSMGAILERVDLRNGPCAGKRLGPQHQGHGQA